RLEKPLGPEVKYRNRAVMKLLGAEDLSACDISRVLRLPGTINHPTPTKLKKGRVPCMSALIEHNEARYAPDVFPVETNEQGSPDDGAQHSRQKVDIDIETLPISERMRALIKGIDHPENEGLYPTRNHGMFAVLVAMAGAGCLDEEMAAVMDNYPIG